MIGAKEVLEETVTRIWREVGQTLKLYDRAYEGLTHDRNPENFRRFLLSGRTLFIDLGERIGKLEQLVSFWDHRLSNHHNGGMSPDDEADIEVTYPEEYAQRRLAGKTVQFHATVKGIRRKDLLTSARTVLRQAVRQPLHSAKHVAHFGLELKNVLLGKSALQPEGDDRRPVARPDHDGEEHRRHTDDRRREQSLLQHLAAR